MWRDAILVLGKDLRIEMRSHVARNQILPFAVTVLLLFGLALGPDEARLRQAAAGLFWVTVLFATVLAIHRSFAIERQDGALDGLRLSGIDPAGVFVGKAAALSAELVALEIVLAAIAAVLFAIPLGSALLLIGTAAVATLGLAAIGTVYGLLAATSRVHETLLPLLFLPVTAPVLLGAVKAWEAGIAATPGAGLGWLALLVAFAAIYLSLGTVAFGALLEGA